MSSSRSHSVAAARRAGWSLGDQILSSMTNFALTIAIAKSVSARDFGAFAIAYTLSFLFLQLIRAMASEPLLVRYSAVSPESWRQAVAQAAGTSVVVGLIGGGLAALAATAFTGALRSALLILAAILPLILLQDLWRYAFFSLGRPRRAAENDLVWLLVQTTAFVLLLATAHDKGLVALMCAWGAAAAAGAVYGCLQSKILPRPFGCPRWLRTHWDLIPRYVGEFLAFRGAMQISLYTLGAISGLSAVGALRAAQTLFGPLNVFFLGAGVAGIPEGVRIFSRSHRQFTRLIKLAAFTMGAIACICGMVALALPPSVGSLVLGRSWPGAHSVLLPTAVYMVTVGAMTGPWIGLRSLGAARHSFRAGWKIAAISGCAALAGAVAAGAVGAATGIALGGCAASVIWWHEYKLALHAKGPASA